MAFQVPGVWLKETEQRFGSEGLVPIVAVPTMLCANVNSLSLSEPQSLLYTRENATILFGFGGWPSESPTLHKYLSLFFFIVRLYCPLKALSSSSAGAGDTRTNQGAAGTFWRSAPG